MDSMRIESLATLLRAEKALKKWRRTKSDDAWARFSEDIAEVLKPITDEPTTPITGKAGE